MVYFLEHECTHLDRTPVNMSNKTDDIINQSVLPTVKNVTIRNYSVPCMPRLTLVGDVDANVDATYNDWKQWETRVANAYFAATEPLVDVGNAMPSGLYTEGELLVRDGRVVGRRALIIGSTGF
jgi:hypothetical protein